MYSVAEREILKCRKKKKGLDVQLGTSRILSALEYGFMYSFKRFKDVTFKDVDADFWRRIMYIQ